MVTTRSKTAAAAREKVYAEKDAAFWAKVAEWEEEEPMTEEEYVETSETLQNLDFGSSGQASINGKEATLQLNFYSSPRSSPKTITTRQLLQQVRGDEIAEPVISGIRGKPLSLSALIKKFQRK